MLGSRKGWGSLVLLLVFVGAGCSAPNCLEPGVCEKAVRTLSFSSGDQIVLRETFFGVGGKIVNFLNGDGEERMVDLTAWNMDESIDLTWSMTSERETPASVETRRAFDEQYAHIPVGTKIPDAPKPVLETTTKSGTIVAGGITQATHIALPAFWLEGDQTFENNSLIWLTKQQYQQLSETRETQINLGLFDNSLAFAQSLSDRANDLVNLLSQSKTEEEREDILTVKAEPEWGAYRLIINGEPKVVRTLQAQNAFARYTILANENNPLILEIVLSPLSKGSVNVFSRENLLQAFAGYEVVSITQNASSSAHPLQP